MKMPNQLVILATTAAALLAGCATPNPTVFKEVAADGYGAKIESLDSGVLVSKFIGNSDTPAAKAYALAALGAYDHCAKTGQLAQVNDSVEDSPSVNYTQLFSTSQYFMTARGHHATVTGRATRYGAAFKCKKQRHVLVGAPRVQEIAVASVSPITKDGKGGLLLAYERLADAKGLQDDDVVVNVNGTRVEKAGELFDAIDSSKLGKAEFRIIRYNNLATATSELVDATSALRENEKNQINDLCNSIGIEIDLLAGNAGYQRAKELMQKESGQKPVENVKDESSQELCRRLRSLPILKAPKAAR